MILASLPDTPVNGPLPDSSETTTTQIKVTYDPVLVTGGSPITSYELQMGSLSMTDFETVSGGADQLTLSLFAIITKGVQKGKKYAFRYRVLNAVGACGWSPVTEISAATIPAAPPSPKLISSTATSITLGFRVSSDNGGSKILSYRLQRDEGDLATAITTVVAGYDGVSSTYTVTGLTPGKKYRFEYYAVNSFGDSNPSNSITVAASALPIAPTAPMVDWSKSAKTSLYIYWSTVTDPDSPVIGYILEMDDGKGGAFSTIFDGSFQPGTTIFLKTSLTKGLKYSFKVSAMNYNGLSPASPISSYYACSAPSSFAAPTVVSQSVTAITL